MSGISAGDLARSLMLRRQTAALKGALTRHSQELTTGRAAAPLKALRGDVGALAAVERNRDVLTAYATATAEVATMAAGQQRVLGRLAADALDLSGELLKLGPGTPPGLVTTLAATGRAGFETTVDALNTRVADRSLFAGVAVDRPALAPAGEILDALLTDIAGLTDPDDIEAAVRTWFDTPGGGFEAAALRGSADPGGPVAIAPDAKVTLAVTAARAELRPLLSGLALTAVVETGPPGATQADRRALLERAGLQLFQAQGGLIDLGAELGTAEARIAAAESRNAAESVAMELARDALVGVDPYEAATRLEDVRARIEAVFTLTARLQRLSLVEYLR